MGLLVILPSTTLLAGGLGLFGGKLMGCTKFMGTLAAVTCDLTLALLVHTGETSSVGVVFHDLFFNICFLLFLSDRLVELVDYAVENASHPLLCHK